MKMESYFCNNIVEQRPEDRRNRVTLIDGSGVNITCKLNGYAIIPIEEYYRLKGKRAPSDDVESINTMNDKLANPE